MTLYKVNVVWSLYGTYMIEANSEIEASEIAEELPLPDGEYLTDSFDIDYVEEA